MIKEKKIQTKYNYQKTLRVIILEYARTVMLSVLAAFIITVGLSIHARNEMIKNLYVNIQTQKVLDKQIAERFIQTNTNLLKGIKNKKYTICMHIASAYESVGDYEKAQIAYESAVEKAVKGNFKPYYRLICVLANQEKFDEINAILNSIVDKPDKKLIKFKTRAYIVMGDKYYSIGKFLSAARSYEKAEFYYSKFVKNDKEVVKSIKNRIINSYVKVADTIVKMGYNSDAVRYLKIVEKYEPKNLQIKYKIGIILADLDPEQSVKYLEPLIDKIPQDIDYGVYCTALMKAANIADLEGRATMAKAYRYKIHSNDLFIKRKVIYKNDIETVIDSFIVRKMFFTYPLKVTYSFFNKTGADIKYLKADFVLSQNDKALETVTLNIANKEKPLIAGGYDSNDISIKFRKAIYTRKELANYTIKIYAYKDEKFKTLIFENTIPQKSIIPVK